MKKGSEIIKCVFRPDTVSGAHKRFLGKYLL